MVLKKLFTPTFIRFCVVGVVNTGVDLGIFVGLRNSGLSIVAANIVSTSVGIVVSYGLNYTYTFKRLGNLTMRRVAEFLAITVIGLWVLQPIIITTIIALDNSVGLTADMGVSAHVQNTIAKLVATGFTLVWNYYFYSRFIFTSDERNSDKSD